MKKLLLLFAFIFSLAIHGQIRTITGAGTPQYIPAYLGNTIIGNSLIYQTGGNIGIGTTSPLAPLYVNGLIWGNTSLILGQSSVTNGQLNFYNAGNANGISMRAASSTGSWAWVLPTAQGGANTVLTNNGSGTLSWAAIGGTISGLTTNRIPKATSSTAIGNSNLGDDGTNVWLQSGKFITSQDPTKSHISFGTTGSEFIERSTDGGVDVTANDYLDPSAYQLMVPDVVTSDTSRGQLFIQNKYTALFRTQQYKGQQYGIDISETPTLSFTGGMKIMSNVLLKKGVPSTDQTTAVFINGKNDTIAKGVKGAVVFGQNRYAKSDYTTYFSAINDSGTFVFKDGNQGSGKVLQSDANGNASWKTAPATGVTSIATASGITGGTITSTGTLKADTGLLATHYFVTSNIAGGSWSLTGNSGTVDGTNFIGNTDDVPFSIYVNNQPSARIDHTLANSYFGYQAGLANTSITTGNNNNGFGYQALLVNTSGFDNSAIGYGSLEANTSGSLNTGNGYKTLFSNTTGLANSAIGYQSLWHNTSGVSNSAIGREAGFNNTTGKKNIFIGDSAGTLNTTGSNNIFIGYQTNSSSATKSNKIYIGNSSDTAVIFFGSKYPVLGNQSLANASGYLKNDGSGNFSWASAGTGTVTSVATSTGLTGGTITTTGTLKADTNLLATHYYVNNTDSVGTITNGTWNATTIAVTKGGTGLTSITTGDLVQGTASNTLSTLSSVSSGSYLRSAGTTTANVWSTLKLPNSATANYIPYGTATNTWGESSNLQFTGTYASVGGAANTGSFGQALQLFPTNTYYWQGYYNTGLAHGMTGLAPTNCAAFINIYDNGANGGGFQFFGLTGSTASNPALDFNGVSGAATPTMTPVRFRVTKKSGTGNGALASTDPAFGFLNNSTSLITILGNGNSGFGGTTTPSAQIHLAAGTATASTAPLKFTSGTNLTTTEAGAIEFNGTHLFFTATNSGTRYQLDQQGVSNYVHNISTPTTGGTVTLTNNQYNIINPSGALLALTVNLPSSPVNNVVVYIKFTQNVTTVTYVNGTVVDGITAPTAGGMTVLTYDSGTTSWY